MRLINYCIERRSPGTTAPGVVGICRVFMTVYMRYLSDACCICSQHLKACVICNLNLHQFASQPLHMCIGRYGTIFIHMKLCNIQDFLIQAEKTSTTSLASLFEQLKSIALDQQMIFSKGSDM